MPVSTMRIFSEQEEFPSIYDAKPWIVCLSAALFFFYGFFQLNIFNSIDVFLMQTFGLNAEQLGSLGSASLFANVLFLFPAGLLLDRFSVKKLMLLAMFLCVLGTYLFSQSHHFWTAWVYRFLTGIGSAFSFLSCIRLASRWFAPRHLALVTGLTITLAMIGGIVAQAPLTLLVNHHGWRQALRTDAFVGLILLGVMFCFLKNYPLNTRPAHIRQKSQILGFWRSLQLVLLKRQNWCGAFYACFMNLPLMVLGAVWGGPYLAHTYHLSPLASSVVISMIFIGMLLGAPVMGWVSDHLERRRLPMMVGSLLAFAIMAILIIFPLISFTGVLLLFLSLGFVCSAQTISYPLISESNPVVLTATAVSLVVLITQGLGACFQRLFGWLLVQGWNGEMIDQIPVYSTAAYYHAILLIPFGFSGALLAALLMRETRARPLED